MTASRQVSALNEGNPNPNLPAAPRISLRLAALLWLISFLPHLALALLFFHTPIALDDMFQYDMLARSLAAGNGYRWYAQADVNALKPYLKQYIDVSKLDTPPQGLPTTFRPPGYPFFLAAIYRLTPLDSRFGFVRLAQAALMALLAPAAALLALKLGAGRQAAVWSGLGMGFYPILLFYPVALASEDLFIPLTLFALLALLWASQRLSFGWVLLAGLLLGLATLTRSVLALFIPLAALWLALFGWRRTPGLVTPARRVLYALLLLAAGIGVCLPWAVRNTQLTGRPTFIETSLGYQMYIGYHPEGSGSFVSRVAIQPLTILDDIRREDFCLQAALEFIRLNPLQAAERVFQRVAYFVSVEDRELMYFYGNNFLGAVSQPWLALAYLAMVLPWVAIGLLAPLGILAAPNRPAVWLAAALVLGYALPHLLIIAEPRFHLALVPVFLPLAMIGWSRRGEALRRMRASRRIAWPVLCAWLLLIFAWVWSFALNWNRLASLMAPGGNALRLTY